MPVGNSEELLNEVGRLIEQACENGDTVSAIAERAAVQRDFVSGLRNGTYRAIPSVTRVHAVLKAIGYRFDVKPLNAQRQSIVRGASKHANDK